tara:strand:+ start:353 stop:583 length:231 start_codon:yes stop_codon:yes gene_type:complete
MKWLNKNQLEITNDNYIIYITKEKNPDTEYYLYFVDVFENKYNPYNEEYDSVVFDDKDLAFDYVKNNYNVEVINNG